jgi:hypothetical protein
MPRNPSLRETSAAFLLISASISQANVTYRTFEPSTDSIRFARGYFNEGSSSNLTLDTIGPLLGKGSAHLEFKLGGIPWEGPYAGLVFGYDTLWRKIDLTKYSGIHVRIKSDVAVNLWINPYSEFYPLPHHLDGYDYGWNILLYPGVLDTILPFRALDVRPYFKTQPLFSSLPPIDSIFVGTSAFQATVSPWNQDSVATAAGNLWLDGIELVGQDSLVPGRVSRKFVFKEFEDTAFARIHSDSFDGVFKYGNPTSKIRISSDTGAWGLITPRLDYKVVPDPGKTYSAWVGAGFAMPALDMTGLTRLEFVDHVAATGNFRVSLMSDRYPQVLVDTGIAWGWTCQMIKDARPNVGQSLLISKLDVEDWAKTKTSLYALLPPVDSILKGVSGVRFQAMMDWSSDGKSISGSDSGHIRFDHFIAVGIDSAPASAKLQHTTAIQSKSPTLSPLQFQLYGNILHNTGSRTLEIRSLSGSAIARLGSHERLTLENGTWIAGNGSDRRLFFVP